MSARPDVVDDKGRKAFLLTTNPEERPIRIRYADNGEEAALDGSPGQELYWLPMMGDEE